MRRKTMPIRSILAVVALISPTAGLTAKAEQAAAPASACSCESFRAWYLAHERERTSAVTQAQNAEGVALARERRAELKSLMQRDPAIALKWAVPAAARTALPKDVADELETEISGTGYVGVLMADPATETNAAPSVSMTVNGQVLRVFLHGNQLNRKQWYGEPVQGIVLDDMAVMEDAGGVTRAARPLRKIATKTVTRTYTPDRATIAREGEYDRIGLDGLTAAGIEPGMPALPREFIHVALPPGVTVKDIRVSFNETKIRDGVIPMPAQRAMTTSESSDTNATPPDAAIYSGTDIWPADVATLAGDNNRAGHRYVSLLVHPLRYIGATKSLYGSSEVTVSVDYELPVIEPAAPADERIVEAKASVQSLVVNPEEVQSPAEPVTLIALDSAPQLTEGGSDRVDYLIITSDELASAFTNLAAHRQAHDGFVTAIRTVSDITNSYPAADAVTSIRNCIIDYYTTSNLQYVVLGGDWLQVPVYYREDFPSDLYFSGLDAHSPQPDFAYEVIVGRIPVNTAAQVADYVGKVVDYDTNPPWDVSRKLLFEGNRLWNVYTSTNRPTDTLDDGHVQFQDALHSSVSDSERWLRRLYRDFVQTNGYRYVTGFLFDTLTSWDVRLCGDYVLSKEHLAGKVDYGWNQWIRNGHGSEIQFETEKGWYEYGYDRDLALAQTNGAVVVYPNSCQTAAFDQWQDPCMAEAFLRNPQGGALIYIAATRNGWGVYEHYYGGHSNEYISEWLKQVFIEKQAVAGKAFAEHKLALAHLCEDLTWYRWLQFSINFFGDPALRLIGTKPSVTVQAADPVTVEGGAASARFVVSRDPVISNLTVNVSYAGTATGTDMVESLPTTLTFTNGESYKVFTVTAVDDSAPEPDETLTVSIVPDASYEPGNRLPATITIKDAPPLPVLSLSASPSTIREWTNALPNGPFTLTNTAEFVLARTGDTNAAVTVSYLISGTARTNDYILAGTGAITLAAGQMSTHLAVTAVDNAYPDGDRSLVMTLQPDVGYHFGVSEATITILDDDPPPTITVSAPDATMREHSFDTGTFRITRTGNTTLPYTLSFTVGGNCQTNRYAMPASPLTIPAGASSLDLLVTPLNDEIPDITRQIVLAAGSSSASITMLDDDNAAPSVTFTATPDACELGDQVTLSAIVLDDLGISNVTFYVEGEPYASFSGPPYQMGWTACWKQVNDAWAVATDIHGATATGSTSFAVSGFPEGPGTGFLAEWWTNVVGTGLAALTNDVRYPQSPDGSEICSSNLAYTLPTTNSYGVRLRGFFVAPKDGNYRITYNYSFGSAAMYLSTDESPANMAATSYNVLHSLMAGHRYYFEMLYMHDANKSPSSLLQGYYYYDIDGFLDVEDPIRGHRLEPWYELAVVADTNAITVEAGGTAQFNIDLNQAPTGTVNVSVGPAGGDGDVSVQGATNFTFDAGNWDTPQTVTLTAGTVPNTLPGVATIVCLSPSANPACVTVTVPPTATNNPPVAILDYYTAMQDAPLVVAAPGVLDNDGDAETNALTATVASDPTHGVLSLEADGSFTYTPNTGWSGTDSFTYKANDGQYDSDPATVTLTVLARPHVSFVYSLTNLSEVIVGFERPVKTTPAEAVSNYTIDQGVSVLSADLDYDQQTVRLVVSGLADGKIYTLTVNNVNDYTTGAPIQPDTRATFMFGVSVLGGLFPLPYQDTYESYARGSNLAGSVWTVLSGDGAQAAVAAATPPVPASGYPVPEAGHTNAMDYFGPIMLALDGETTSNLMTVALDTMIRPVLGAPTGDALAAMTDGQAALYFDTNGFINVFHGVRASSVAGPPESTAWLALTNAPPVPAGEWCRLTVVMSYDFTGPMAMFAVAIDSNLISAAEGYVQASLDSGHGGPWLISPTWDDADLRLHSLTFGGGGWLDDLTLTPGGAVQMAIHGVPVVWMQATGLATNMIYPTWDALSLGDPDGDGHPTWQEYIAGTDPNRASSVLNIVSSPIATPAGEIVLRWTSSEGRTYVIQRSTNLAAQSFGDLWTGISATPPENTYTGTVTETAVPAFYRISVDH